MPLNSNQLLNKYEQTLSCCLTSTSNTIDYLFASAGAMPVGGTNVCATDPQLIVNSSCLADKTVAFSQSLNMPVKFDSSNTEWTTLSGNTAIQNSQSFYMWGYDPGYWVFAKTSGSSSAVTSPTLQPGLPNNWRNISFHYNSSYPSFLGATTSGALVHCGANFYLFTCSGQNCNVPLPYEIYAAGSDWLRADQGITGIGFGLKTDGRLYTFGCNWCGMYGDNQTASRQLLTRPLGLENCCFTNYAMKKSCHALAIESNGTLWSWGLNNSGQLGDGTTITRSCPATIAGGGTWCCVDTSNRSSMGVKTDGSLWGWGLNSSGQLGDGTTIGKSSPVSVAGGGNDWCIVHMTLQDCITYGIKIDGTFWSWGTDSSNYCKLGSPGVTTRSSPATLSIGGSDWCAVDAGRYAAYALKTNGTLWSWGYDYYGALGLSYPCGTTCCVSVPTCIPGRNDWYSLHAGFHTGGATTITEII